MHSTMILDSGKYVGYFTLRSCWKDLINAVRSKYYGKTVQDHTPKFQVVHSPTR